MLGDDRHHSELLPDVLQQYGEAIKKGAKHVVMVRFAATLESVCRSADARYTRITCCIQCLYLCLSWLTIQNLRSRWSGPALQ
jgi:hypothetical protein